MGIVSGGGGGGAAFNGGTITTPLTVNPSNTALQALVIDRGVATGDDAIAIYDENGHEEVGIYVESGFAQLRMSQGTTTRFNLATSTGIGTLQAASNNQSLAVRAPVSGAAAIVSWQNSGGTQVASVLPAGQLLTAAHAAPADADLGAGDLTLWFDQTNGAGKLMVKGKTADGTVVAASVALA